MSERETWKRSLDNALRNQQSRTPRQINVAPHYGFFFSFAGEDRKLAVRLREMILQTNGMNSTYEQVFLDDVTLEQGDILWTHINQACVHSIVFVALVGSHYLHKRAPLSEALLRAQSGLAHNALLVLLDGIKKEHLFSTKKAKVVTQEGDKVKELKMPIVEIFQPYQKMFCLSNPPSDDDLKHLILHLQKLLTDALHKSTSSIVTLRTAALRAPQTEPLRFWLFAAGNSSQAQMWIRIMEAMVESLKSSKPDNISLVPTLDECNACCCFVPIRCSDSFDRMIQWKKSKDEADTVSEAIQKQELDRDQTKFDEITKRNLRGRATPSEMSWAVTYLNTPRAGELQRTQRAKLIPFFAGPAEGVLKEFHGIGELQNGDGINFDLLHRWILYSLLYHRQ